MGCNSMKVSAVAIDKQQDDDIYETETDIALENPPISVKVLGEARLYREMTIEVQFKNTLNEPLRNCTLTVCGCGLFSSDVERSIAQLDPNRTLKLKIMTTPYKAGLKAVVADFDCSAFRDIKASCVVNVTR
ncbi:protein-glutamine gamma-glutamyltransferase E-like [Larimichthys crocea]|nr:protein-glutamine gamma-glutamyltransferase E-like [Larimichthys crocea]